MVFEEIEEHDVRLYKQPQSSKKDPTKLFVGGMHGKEGVFTAPLLEILVRKEKCIGEVIIVPNLAKNSDYIDVLSEEYYHRREGKILISLIKKYKPSFYFELHSYGEDSYFRLTDPGRVKKAGVPPFVDLWNGILLGSIAPILRRKFNKNDLCVTMETPKRRSEKVREEILKILRILGWERTKEEVMDALRMRYPEPIERGEEFFRQYYGDEFEPF